mmetsp:Transcript_28745/g.89588  ORF Transcript_28745/g.89588 Transcript_28745/m.89588 type:complete len:800 (+) Transcript_28745:98-2497(+)
MYIPKREPVGSLGTGDTASENDYKDFEAVHPVSPFSGADEGPRLLRARSSLERIERTAQAYSEKATELLIQQDACYVDRDELGQVVVLQRERLYGCLSLPFSLAFFLLFALSAFLHEDITNVFLIESGLREQLGAGLSDVQSIQGVWDWINGSLVPKLFVQHDLLGAPILDKSLWSRVLMYNHLQGPMVMQQLRSEREPCNDGGGIAGAMVCYPVGTQSRSSFGREANASIATPMDQEYTGGLVHREQRQRYYGLAFQAHSRGRRLRIARGEYMPRLSGGPVEGNAFEAFLYANTNYSLVQEHVNYLHQRGWLDAQSKEVIVKALLLNAEVGRPRLEQVHVNFFFSRGGGVFARLTLESLFLLVWSDAATVGTDVLWLMMLLFTSITEVLRIRQAIKKRSLCRMCQQYTAILQWLMIALGWLCVLGYLVQDSMRRRVLDRFGEVIDAQMRDVPAELNTLGIELHDETDRMKFFTSWFRIVIAEYHLVLLFSFFTAFRSQPRLGVVTGTLESSVVDIVHFLLVLVPTFMAYAITGCFIFGRRLEEFSTLQGAMGVCFRMLMEGEYDWPALSEEYPLTAGIWVWTFMLLLVLLMLNMVLAIVMDVYTEMRKHSGKSETVWTTMTRMLHQLWHWKRWVANDELKESVQRMSRFIRREELLERFPRMCQPQYEGLVRDCICMKQGSAGSFNEAVRMQMAVFLGMDKITEEILDLYKSATESLSSGAGCRFTKAGEATGWLQDISERMALQNHRMLSVQWQLQQLQWQWLAMEAVCSRNGNSEPVCNPMEADQVGGTVEDEVVL